MGWLPQKDPHSLMPARTPAATFGASPHVVGSQKQLLVDDALIATSRDISLTVNRPIKDEARCLTGEHPWESWTMGLYACVLRAGDTFRMWYTPAYSSGEEEYCLRLCYATSTDGLHWEKPDLGLVPFAGNTRNNIVFPPASLEGKGDGNPPSFDTNPDCPAAERYKMPFMRFHAEKGNEIVVYVSPDGLRWRALSEKPSCGRSDTNNVIFWDESIGRYVAMVRKMAKGTACWRRVGRCEFDDMRDWGEVQEVLAPDAADPPNVDIYTNAVVKYEGVYLMFPSFYSHYPEPAEVKREKGKLHNDGIVDIRFATSRDGMRWDRHDRRPFVPLGADGAWDCRQAYMCTGLLEMDDEIWMYYTGMHYSHAEDAIIDPHGCAGGICRLRLRRDGFVSADAPYGGGEMTTVPLTFEGAALVLNVETGAGGCVAAEVLDQAGQSIPGFALDDCVGIEGNHIREVVAWKGGSDLGSLAGEPVSLRFVMRDAKLYSFRFRP